MTAVRADRTRVPGPQMPVVDKARTLRIAESASPDELTPTLSCNRQSSASHPQEPPLTSFAGVDN